MGRKIESAEKVFNPSNRGSALARITSPKANHSVLNTAARLAHTSAGLSHSSVESAHTCAGLAHSSVELAHTCAGLVHSSARLAICVISDFRREVDENCALLGYHAASRPLHTA